MRKYYSRCGLHCGKMIGVVAYTVEKWSVCVVGNNEEKCLSSNISTRIRNYMRIYNRVSIRGLGWCVSGRKIEVKNLLELSVLQIDLNVLDFPAIEKLYTPFHKSLNSMGRYVEK
jgi:hypothetical protein